MFSKKKSKSKLKLCDVEVTIFYNFTLDNLYEVKSELKEVLDPVECEDLLIKKYTLYNILKQLGFTTYNKELLSRLPISKEVSNIIDNNKAEFKKNDSKAINVPVESNDKVELVDGSKDLDFL